MLVGMTSAAEIMRLGRRAVLLAALLAGMLVSVIGVSVGPWLKSPNSTITDALDGHPGYTAFRQ
jgi:hypothetical protein